MNKDIINKLKQLNLSKRRFKKQISKFCNVTLRYWLIKFIYKKQDVYCIKEVNKVLIKFFNARAV
jgi:hypothetical protein